jgi:hypothetical protein
MIGRVDLPGEGVVVNVVLPVVRDEGRLGSGVADVDTYEGGEQGEAKREGGHGGQGHRDTRAHRLYLESHSHLTVVADAPANGVLV